MRLILTLAIASPCYAGWLGRRCARLFEAIAQEDPYQYEEVPGAWITREIERIDIRVQWGRATEKDLRTRTLLENELKRRRCGECYGPEAQAHHRTATETDPQP